MPNKLSSRIQNPVWVDVIDLSVGDVEAAGVFTSAGDSANRESEQRELSGLTRPPDQTRVPPVVSSGRLG